MEDCVTKFDEYAPPLVDIAPPDVRTRLYFGKLLINHPDAREAVCEGEGRVKPRGDNDPAGLVGVAPPAVLVNRAGPSPLRTSLREGIAVKRQNEKTHKFYLHHHHGRPKGKIFLCLL